MIQHTAIILGLVVTAVSALCVPTMQKPLPESVQLQVFQMAWGFEHGTNGLPKDWKQALRLYNELVDQGGIGYITRAHLMCHGVEIHDIPFTREDCMELNKTVNMMISEFDKRGRELMLQFDSDATRVIVKH